MKIVGDVGIVTPPINKGDIMIIMSTEEWKIKSEAWKEPFLKKLDELLADDVGMTIEERAKKILDWEERLKYAATHLGGVRPTRCDHEDN